MSVGNKELATVNAQERESEAVGEQFLTFTLAGEVYGVDILRVQEIKGWSPVTRIPNAPGFIKGVMNLRGTIVPIIDLRLRFNLEEVEYTPTTVVIVLSVRGGSGSRTFGIVVDGVSDVITVADEEIRPAPDFGTAVNTEFIDGLATVADEMVMLLDVDRLLSTQELQSLETIQNAPPPAEEESAS